MGWRDRLGVGERRWKKAPDEEVQPAKTLWDWLQLLIVPAILIGVTFVWSASQARSDNRREDRRIAADRAAAQEARRDATLQAYLDQMSGLMLDRNLLTSKAGDPVRDVARTVTLTTLSRLDGSRKGELVHFLQEAGLIRKRTTEEGGTVVEMVGADLTDADLSGADLTDANLSFANLTRANLHGAFVEEADLSEADLTGAELRFAYLQRTALYHANLADAELTGADLLDADFTGADLSDANLAHADLSGAQNLDLGLFITDLPPERRKEFLDSQKQFLDSLSREELAKVNLTPEKLAKFRSLANGG